VTTDANSGSSFNRYDYANNSPYKYLDPDGRQATMALCGGGPIGCAIGAGLTALTAYVGAKAVNDTQRILQSRSDPKKSDSQEAPKADGKTGPKTPTNLQPTTNPPQAPVIPGDWVSQPGSKGGEVFFPPGTDPANGENIRVMPPGSSPLPGQQDGYWVWTSPSGQPLDPSTGKPGNKGATHVPLPPKSEPPPRRDP
jgi:hypothetical protein